MSSKNFEKPLFRAISFHDNHYTSDQPLDKQLKKFFHQHRNLGSRDRRLITNAIFAYIRWQKYVNKFCEQIGKRGMEFKLATALACEGNIGEDEYLEFIDKRFHSELYENLRQKKFPETLREDPQTVFGLEYSFQVWMIEEWIDHFGEDETLKLMNAINQRAPLCVWHNPIKGSLEELQKQLIEQNFLFKRGKYSPYALISEENYPLPQSKLIQQGLVEIQDEGSQCIAIAMKPEKQTVIWDACAGGGGKTVFLAMLKENQGKVLASDIRDWKLAEIERRAERLGLKNIEVIPFEAIKENPLLKNKEVDQVLIDAPCSGSGTMRRNPDYKWRLKQSDILELQQTQLKILKEYQLYVRSGGDLFYATCSLFRDENEKVVDSFLAEHPDFERDEEDHYFLPHTHDSDGFFLAKLKRRS